MKMILELMIALAVGTGYTGVACAQKAIPSDFGIGFALHFDYGIAAIHQTNGSSSGIAKIEGSEPYTRMMRSQDWAVPKPYSPTPAHSAVVGAPSIAALGEMQGLRVYLPPWLGGPKPDARVEILEPMLKALNAAAVAYTGTADTIVAVTFPAQPSKDFIPAVKSAAAVLRVKKVIVSAVSPAIYAADAHSLTTEPCYGDGDYSGKRLILAVDFTRAAMSSTLLSMECAIYDDLRSAVNTSLGLAHWSEATHETLVADLQHFLRPVHDIYDERLEAVE